MVCKANTRSILVWAERPYFQCSLLLVLLCTEVLVVGGYKLVERGITPRSLYVGVCLVHCHCVVLSFYVACWSRVPPSLFIVCKGRGWITVFGCTKMERECPKVLPIPCFPLSSCFRTVFIAVVAHRGCRWCGEAIP
jgi:hypothetical protein